MQLVVNSELARRILSRAVSCGADFAEIYVEDRRTMSLHLEDSKVEEAVRGLDRGAGVRVFYGGLAAYAHTDDLSESSLVDAAQKAASAARRGNKTRVLDFSSVKSKLDFPVRKAFHSVAEVEKAELLRRVDREARRCDARVTQVQASYGEDVRHIWIWNSDGRLVEDERNLIQLSVVVLAQKNGLVQRGVGVVGGQMGLELLDRKDPLLEAREAVESAVTMLDARAAPAGEMPVVMNNGWGGVLFHEASGHALEGDFVNQGVSVFTGKLGERVASPLVTLVDDSTLPERRGSFRFDDEGTESQRTVLIEGGVLKGYMWDLAQARRANRSSTGNGRRQSFRHLPMPRMTNTFIEAGDRDPEEIVSSVKKGLFVKMLGGGQADTAKGDFVFSVSEGYLIENGKLTAPVRGANLIGNGPEVLGEISMVGHDLELDKGLGTCGKGQRVPVSVGQPTLLIPRITVGGTDESF
jgi:TldD protein